MATIQEKIAKAKAAGYSDADISKHLSAQADMAPKIRQAESAGYTPEQIVSHLSGGVSTTPAASAAPPSPESRDLSLGDIAIKYGKRKLEETRDLGAGLVRGTGSVGQTLLTANEAIGALKRGQMPSLDRDRERRASMDWALKDMGADTDSGAYQVGKLGAEIAGTAGAGSAIGHGVRAVAPTLISAGLPAARIGALANAATSSGFRTGATAAELAAPGGRIADLATRAVGGAASGGAAAGLVDPRQAKTGMVIGGALPGATALAGKAGGAIRSAMTGGGASDEVAALAARAKELGIPIPADRLVDSKPLNAIAASLNYVPLSGRAASEKAMESGLNRALSRTFGQNTDNVTLALRKAQDDLGGKFDDVLKNNKVRVDNDFMNEIGSIETAAQRELNPGDFHAIKGQIDEILNKGANGEINGQAAYNIKRTLDRMGGYNTPAAYHAIEMKKALIEALNRSIGPAKAAAFAETRKQYGNMLALEKIAKNGAEGDISVARLANMRNINNKELQELADISAQFVKAREGQHGAMQRIAMGTVGGVAAGTGAAPIAALAGGMAAGRGTNMLLNSELMRKAVMSQPGPTSENAAKLIQNLYRTAPVAYPSTQGR